MFTFALASSEKNKGRKDRGVRQELLGQQLFCSRSVLHNSAAWLAIIVTDFSAT